jgi:hypothetical protein
MTRSAVLTIYKNVILIVSFFSITQGSVVIRNKIIVTNITM